uniref:Activator of basal transcription 1 n=1 Tax=Parascaris equorum TaxID=6256 RepID=A0A914RKS7_PAREQ
MEPLRGYLGGEDFCLNPKNDTGREFRKQIRRVNKKLKQRRILSKGEDPEERERRSGIIYFQSLPPFFTVTRMREEMSKFGEIGRIYLQAEKRRNANNAKGKRRKRFTEGWVEFKDKSRAKRVAASLNNTAVEKGEQLRKLEEKVLKKGGVWEKFQRQVQQRTVVRKNAKREKTSSASDEQLMKMIFAE